MNSVRNILIKVTALIMTVILTAIPYAGKESREISNKKEGCLLNVQLISDTHVEENDILRSRFLVKALENIVAAQENVDIDLLLVGGDITNYADEPSLAKYYDIIKKYPSLSVITVAGNHDIGHVGDKDVTDITREEAHANFIRYSNDYYGTDFEHNYYSLDVNGYRFIVLGDEVIDGGHWDSVEFSDEQIDFLDKELADGTKEGRPVFVCCHWPVDGINGQAFIQDGEEFNLSSERIKTVMEKYSNVFYISGHLHSGIKSTLAQEKFSPSTVEQVNGVTYINLPTFGIINRYGAPQSGTGIQMEVYEDEIIFRPRNLMTNVWYTNSAFTIELK